MRGFLLILVLLSASARAAESGILGAEVPDSPVLVDLDHPFVTINFSFYVSSPATTGVTYVIYETGDRLYEEYDLIQGKAGGGQKEQFHWLALKYNNASLPEGPIHISAFIRPADGDTDMGDNFILVNFTLQGPGFTGVRSFSSVPANPLEGDILDFYVSVVNGNSSPVSGTFTLNNSTAVLATRSLSLPASFEQLLYFEELAVAGAGCENFSAGFRDANRIITVCPRERMNVAAEVVPEYPPWALILLVIGVFALVEFSGKG